MKELIDQLVQAGSVQPNQAKGVVGMIFELVKEHLEPEEFQEVQDQLPGVEEAIAGKPDFESGAGGLLGGALNALGGQHLGGLVSLATGCKKLGLNLEDVQALIPRILGYVQSVGGARVLELVKKAIG